MMGLAARRVKARGQLGGRRAHRQQRVQAQAGQLAPGRPGGWPRCRGPVRPWPPARPRRGRRRAGPAGPGPPRPGCAGWRCRRRPGPGGRRSPGARPRWGEPRKPARPRRRSASSMPRARAARIAAARLAPLWAPGRGTGQSAPSSARMPVPSAAGRHDHGWSPPRPNDTTLALLRARQAAKPGLSALSTAAPPGGRASSSSPLPWMMPSRLPNSARWAGEALVMMPTWGAARGASRAISPTAEAPISITAKRWAARRPSRVSGTPRWLLRLPPVACTAARAAPAAPPAGPWWWSCRWCRSPRR